MPFEKTALGNEANLAASAKKRLGNIDCRKVRTASITCRVDYHGSATSGVRVNLYFAADGTHFDTVAYATFDVNLSTGSTVQETHVFDFPEHGYMDVEIENLDGAYAATNIMVFDTIVKWND